MEISFVTSDTFRQLFKSMSEGIIMVEESGKISIANPVAEKMFGYGNDELIGMALEDLLPERYRGNHIAFRQGFNAHPEPRKMGIGRDLTALRKDGTEIPVEISLSYTRVDESLFIMAFISDISLRKKTEDALKRSEEQLIVYAAELEHKVKARTEALNTSIAKLEREIIERKKAEEEVRKSLERERELNELKSKFVSIASHEFRTPLSTVMSSASLIQQYKDKNDLEKIDKHIQRIKSSVDHLTSILNDFLSLGKLEEGKVDIQPEKIPVQNFLKEISEEMTSLKDGQQIKIDCQADLSIQTDPRILRNVLFNLISNASKYSDRDKVIYLGCVLQQNHLVFSVSDEGIGIPVEDQKYLFDRFFRASNAINIQGSGLGLNIVKRYVDLLRGTITFTSEYQKGSTFTVSMPQK
ncbi:MAG TPA: PAS domain-containing sensor histidine kinase [Cyclobacteriaceae bacterium]|nr:PAS domain-containing sensor histidine kinase [Cyclobacteriaceae bacterium]